MPFATTDSSANSRKHRHKDEFRIDAYFPVTFRLKGERQSALISDISIKGARLSMANSLSDLRPEIDTELLLDIQTPYENIQCIAKVRWINTQAEPATIGVEFTKGNENNTVSFFEVVTPNSNKLRRSI